MMRRTIVFLLTIVIIIASLQWLLPVIGGQIVQRNVAKDVDAESVKVAVAAFPFVKLFQGKADTVDIYIDRMQAGTLQVRSVEMNGRDLEFDIREALSGGQDVLKGPQRLQMMMTLSEDNLTEYFQHELNDINSPDVQITPSAVTFNGSFDVLGRPVRMQVSGVFDLNDAGEIVYIPKGAAIENTPVPDVIMDAISSRLYFAIDVSGFNFAIQFEQIQMNEDEIVLGGTVTL